MENSKQFLKLLNTEIPYNPVIPLLVIYPKEVKAGLPEITHTSIFIAELFTRAKGRSNLSIHQQMTG